MSEAFSVSEGDSKFRQQRLPACRPFLTPAGTAIVFAVLAVTSFTLGVFYILECENTFEGIYRYDDKCQNQSQCQIEVEIKETLHGPVFLYYQITNYHQNHYLYSHSLSVKQLRGAKYNGEKDIKTCHPHIYDRGEKDVKNILVPCGSLAKSVFDDSFNFTSRMLSVNEKNIAIPAFKRIFHDPDPSYNHSDYWLKTIFSDGQKNEHFINWMNAAPFPTFRKLWGRFESDQIEPGKYTVNISNNYDVSAFSGTKSLVISEVSWVGGRNNFFGIFFLTIGGVSTVSSIVLLILYSRNVFELYRTVSNSETLLQTLIN